MYGHPFLERGVTRLTDLVDQVGRIPGREGGGVLIALSGGPDSVALLLVAHAWSERTGRPAVAAHLDHRLRGEESAGDAAFCRQLCEGLGLVLHLRVADPRPVARSRGRGLEEAGRHLRLRLLGELLDADPALSCAATGHHADDQSETVLMRLLRGCGLDGAAGMRPVSGRLIHPLLSETRRDILEFLDACGQPWRQDRTNAADLATRNRMRRELLPLVRDIFGPGAVAAPARFAELAAADLDLLENVTAGALAWCDAANEDPGPAPVLAPRAPVNGAASIPAALSIPRLLSLAEGLARRVLRRWLVSIDGSATDWAARHITDTLAWLRSGQSGQGLDLPHGVRLVRDFDRLHRQFTESGALFPFGDASDHRVGLTPLETVPTEPQAPIVESGRARLVCPADVLDGPVRVRNWRRGDRLETFGLGGTKKVSDLFQTRRVPMDARERALVVEDDAGILWVVGVAQAERTRLLPSTSRLVTICVHERSSPVGGPSGPRSHPVCDRKGSGE